MERLPFKEIWVVDTEFVGCLVIYLTQSAASSRTSYGAVG